jgi:hypothetical protein
MVYRFPITITDVFERKVRKHASGFGDTATFETASAGWYVQIDKSFSIYLGEEKPTFKPGEKAFIQLVRTRHDAVPR